MLLRCINAPSIFIRLINYVLHAFIDRFIVFYFNDTLVYNESLDERINHLRCVLDVLRNEKLYVNLKKHTFCMDKVVFFCYVREKRYRNGEATP
jgi:hypothetical protein